MKQTCLLLVCLWITSAHAITNTNVVAFSRLNVAPEEFKNKQVIYTEVYRNFLTSFPPYMQSSGFKEGKWIILEVGSQRLPVLMKKNEANTDFLAKLKPGSQVRVAGRIKAFRVSARRGMMPDYYVDADTVTLESGPDPTAGFRQQRGGFRQNAPQPER
jgi:hypothetical protein